VKLPRKLIGEGKLPAIKKTLDLKKEIRVSPMLLNMLLKDEARRGGGDDTFLSLSKKNGGSISALREQTGFY